MRELSQGRLELLWAITENLGDWTVVRKRLNEEFQRKQDTPLAATGLETAAATTSEPDSAYFEDLDKTIRDATASGLVARIARPDQHHRRESIPGRSARRPMPCLWRATPP